MDGQVRPNMEVFMRKLLFLLFFIPILLYGQNFTLNQCIERALADNTDIKISDLSVESKDADIGYYKSSLYPHFSLSAMYDENNNYNSSLILSQTIYKKGLLTTVDNGRLNKSIAYEDYLNKKKEIIYNVKEAFFRVVKYKNQLVLSDEIIKRRKESKILINLRYQSGKESYASLKEAEVNLMKAEYDKMLSEQNLKKAKSDLAILINMDDDFDIEYEEKDFVLPEYESVVKLAMENSNEMKIAELEENLARNNKNIYKSGYYPSLSLSGSYGYNSITALFDWTLSLNLSWNLFDGFSTKYKLKSADIAIRQYEIKREALKKSLEKEIENIYENLQLAYKQKELMEASKEVYKIVYRQTKLEYEQGLTSFFILQQKENDLTKGEYDYINALYNLSVQNALLEKLILRGE